MKYNNSTFSLFTTLRERASVSPEVPILFPELPTQEVDSLAEKKFGAMYPKVKKFVASQQSFNKLLGPITAIRVAVGKNMGNSTAATFTFRLTGTNGEGIVQAGITHTALQAELIITKHPMTKLIGTFSRERIH